MANRTRRHSRSHKRSQKRGRGRARYSRRSLAQRGGEASAWAWQLNNLGDGWTQFQNSMTAQPGASGPNSQSNVIVPNKGLSMPSASGPAPAQKGGRRRARGKQGGNWGTVLNQAAVPAAIWAMQYKTKRRR